MAYVLTDGASGIVTYPYNVGLLRRDNPSTSFPARLTEQQLAEWNVFPVTEVSAPLFDPLNFELVENSPEIIDDLWVQVWEVKALDEPSSQRIYNLFAAKAGAQSEELLRACDKEVLLAFEMSTKLHPDFAAYRAALRSPETLPGYPVAPVFPELPTATLSDAVDLSAGFETAIS